jgi:hypothetical protein
MAAFDRFWTTGNGQRWRPGFVWPQLSLLVFAVACGQGVLSYPTASKADARSGQVIAAMAEDAAAADARFLAQVVAGLGGWAGVGPCHRNGQRLIQLDPGWRFVGLDSRAIFVSTADGFLLFAKAGAEVIRISTPGRRAHSILADADAVYFSAFDSARYLSSLSARRWSAHSSPLTHDRGGYLQLLLTDHEYLYFFDGVGISRIHTTSQSTRADRLTSVSIGMTYAIFGHSLYWSEPGARFSLWTQNLTALPGAPDAGAPSRGRLVVVTDDRPIWLEADDTHIYWLEASGSLWRAPLDGSSRQMIADAGAGAAPVISDGPDLFWAEESGIVRRVDKAGGKAGRFADGGAFNRWRYSYDASAPRLLRIAVDETAVYWLGSGDIVPISPPVFDSPGAQRRPPQPEGQPPRQGRVDDPVWILRACR